MFSVIDPHGHRITLTPECWMNHICVVHTEMRSLLEQVRLTVTDPDHIYTSKTSHESFLYFRKYVDPKIKCQYIPVAVHHRPQSRSGYVQSAYPVKSLSKGGTLEWTRL